jgi:lysyl-tRNA synthetase class I
MNNIAYTTNQLKDLLSQVNSNSAYALQQAAKVVQRNHNDNCYTFLMGFCPSGNLHIGTVAEFLCPLFVAFLCQKLRPEYTCRAFILNDNFDMLVRPQLHIGVDGSGVGRCLADIILPTGVSVATHYTKPIMKAAVRLNLFQLGTQLKFVAASRLYISGQYDPMIKDVLMNYSKLQSLFSRFVQHTHKGSDRPTHTIIYPRDVVTGKLDLSQDIKVDGDILVLEDGTRLDPFAGRTKLPFRIEWALRWHTFNCDYEEAGKDVGDALPSAKAFYTALYGTESLPITGSRELWVDAAGKKLSKRHMVPGSFYDINTIFALLPDFFIKFIVLNNPTRCNPWSFQTLIEIASKLLNTIHEVNVAKDHTMVGDFFNQQLIEFVFGSTADIPRVTSPVELKKYVAQWWNGSVSQPFQHTSPAVLDLVNSLYVLWEKLYVKYNCIVLSPMERNYLQRWLDLLNSNTKTFTICNMIDSPKLFKLFYGVVYGATSGPRMAELVDTQRGFLARQVHKAILLGQYQLKNISDIPEMFIL